MNEEILFHLGVEKQALEDARYALLPGDPGRVDKLGALLEDARVLGENREFKTVCGMLEGRKVLVVSTGIGGASAAIAAEELIQSGVTTLLRVGTCGGMQRRIKSGDLVIPTSAIKADGTSVSYLPVEFPAVADFDMVSALCQAAQDCDATYHLGPVHSKDSFYGQHNPESMPTNRELVTKWECYIDGGALASEMECAALFSVAQARKVRAGAVLHAIWNQERENAGLENQENFELERLLKTAVEGLRVLIGWEE